MLSADCWVLSAGTGSSVWGQAGVIGSTPHHGGCHTAQNLACPLLLGVSGCFDN